MWEAFLAFFGFIFLQFAGAKLLVREDAHGVVALFVYAGAALVLVATTFARRGVSRTLGSFEKNSNVKGLLLGCATGAFAITYGTVGRRFGIEMPNGSDSSLPIGALAYVFAAPISEEIFFRGWLQQAIAEESGGNFRRHAPLVASILFMLVHSPSAYLPAFFVGFLAGRLREESGSVGPGLALHAVNNALILIWFHGAR